MAGGSKKSGPSEQEVKLGELGSEKYSAGKNLVAGTDYLTTMAKVDKSKRSKEVSNAQLAEGVAKSGAPVLNNILTPTGSNPYSTAGGAAIAQSSGERNSVMDALGKAAMGVNATASNVTAQQAYMEQKKADEDAKAKQANAAILPSVGGMLVGTYAGSNEIQDSVNGFMNRNILTPVGVSNKNLLSTTNVKDFGRYNKQ